MIPDNVFIREIPELLKGKKRWVLWKEVHGTKLPFIAEKKCSRPASSTDRRTWRSFEEAVEAEEYGMCNGIGFVFSDDDDIIGIDLDNKESSREKNRENIKWIEEFGSYTELSPSGKGYHIIVRGKLDRGINNHGFEAYPNGRFFTMTGNVYGGNKRIIKNQRAIDKFKMAYGKNNSLGVEIPELIQEGQRNDTLYRIGCSLRRRGFSLEDTTTILRYMSSGMGIDIRECRKIIGSVESRNDYGDRESISYGRLAKEIVVHVKSEDKYYDFSSGILITASSMDRAYQSRMEPIGEDEDEIPPPSKYIPHLKSHRTVDSLSWLPSKEQIFTFQGSRCANQYKAPEIIIKKGKVNKWLKHLKYIVSERIAVESVLDWMAFTIQKPEIKINHGLMIGGAPRIGKDLLISPIRYCVGTHNVKEPRAEHLESGFNWYEENSKLIIVQEIHGYHKVGQEDSLKTMLASPPDSVTINVKNRRQYQQPNVSSVIFFTNHRLPLRISTGNSARYLCCWCKEEKKSPKYYRKLASFINGDGKHYIADMLISRDLSSYDPCAPAIETDWCREIVRSSITESEEAISEFLENKSDIWSKDVVTAASVREWCKENGVSYYSVREKIISNGGERIDVSERVNKKIRKVRVWILRNADELKKKDSSEIIEIMRNGKM